MNKFRLHLIGILVSLSAVCTQGFSAGNQMTITFSDTNTAKWILFAEHQKLAHLYSGLSAMQELAINAANSALSDADRNILDAQYQKELNLLKQSIKDSDKLRLAPTSIQGVFITVKNNSHETIHYSLARIDAKSLGLTSLRIDSDLDAKQALLIINKAMVSTNKAFPGDGSLLVEGNETVTHKIVISNQAEQQKVLETLTQLQYRLNKQLMKMQQLAKNPGDITQMEFEQLVADYDRIFSEHNLLKTVNLFKNSQLILNIGVNSVNYRLPAIQLSNFELASTQVVNPEQAIWASERIDNASLFIRDTVLQKI